MSNQDSDGSGYVRYSTFEKCPVHREIREECYARLIAVGFFEKEAVLKAKGFSTMASSIQWQFIQRWLDERNGARVVPVSAAFFRVKDNYNNPNSKAAAELRKANPGKCLASGHGRKTAGYCAVEFHDGLMAQTKLKVRKNVAVGTAKSAVNFEGQVEAKGIKVGHDTVSNALSEVCSTHGKAVDESRRVYTSEVP